MGALRRVMPNVYMVMDRKIKGAERFADAQLDHQDDEAQGVQRHTRPEEKRQHKPSPFDYM